MHNKCYWAWNQRDLSSAPSSWLGAVRRGRVDAWRQSSSQFLWNSPSNPLQGSTNQSHRGMAPFPPPFPLSSALIRGLVVDTEKTEGRGVWCLEHWSFTLNHLFLFQIRNVHCEMWWWRWFYPRLHFQSIPQNLGDSCSSRRACKWSTTNSVFSWTAVWQRSYAVDSLE